MLFISDATLATVVNSMLAALPPTITAIAGIILILKQAEQNSKKVVDIAIETKNKTQEIVNKTTDIHDLTNGSFSKVTEELRLSRLKIDELQETITKGIVARNRSRRKIRKDRGIREVERDVINKAATSNDEVKVTD